MDFKQQLLWIGTLVLVVWAGGLDQRFRRIPNWLSVTGLMLGIATSTLLSGIRGLKLSLEGAGLMLALLFPFVLLRGLGAGDWKLMGAIGAFLGPGQVSIVLLVTCLITGVMGVSEIVRKGRFIATLKNCATLFHSFLVFRVRPHPEINLDNPSLLKLPFGVGAASAVVLCYAARLTLKNL